MKTKYITAITLAALITACGENNNTQTADAEPQNAKTAQTQTIEPKQEVEPQPTVEEATASVEPEVKPAEPQIQVNEEARKKSLDPKDDLEKLPALKIAYDITNMHLKNSEQLDPSKAPYNLNNEIAKRSDAELSGLIKREMAYFKSGAAFDGDAVEAPCFLIDLGGMDFDSKYASKTIKYKLIDEDKIEISFGAFKDSEGRQAIAYQFDNLNDKNPKIKDIFIGTPGKLGGSNKKYTKACLAELGA